MQELRITLIRQSTLLDAEFDTLSWTSGFHGLDELTHAHGSLDRPMETLKAPVSRISRPYRKGMETSLLVQIRETPHCLEDCTVVVECLPGKAKTPIALVHGERCKQARARGEN